MLTPKVGGLKIERPLELVEIDHSPCDCIVVSDDAERIPIGRPWLTVAIDVSTRCVLGMYVSLDPPSATSVALCIESMMLPKDSWLRMLGLDVSWPMYGKTARIHTDNGKDFRGQALQRGCEQYGISLEFRPVRTPHYGAHIERLIGTLMRRLHLLPGTTFSNTRERGDYKSERRSIMTLRELRDWIIHQITSWYHVREHRILGMSPLRAWERGLTSDAGLQLPQLAGDASQVRLAFLPAEERLVRRTGVELWGLRYWDDALAPLIAPGVSVAVRYDPRDIRSIYAQVDGEFIEAKCISAHVEPISLFEYRWRRKLAKEIADDRAQQAVRAEGFRKSDALVETARKLTKQARRQAECERGRQRDVAANRAPQAVVSTDAEYWPRQLSESELPSVEEWNR